VDAAAFRDFVIRYVSVNGRTASPKFLFGESYGTPRSAILVNLLESAGTSMTGVVLQSSILNYNTNCGVFNKPSISCASFLPSYAAVGAWLNLITPPQPVAQLPAYVAQMRTLAGTQYDPAVRTFLGTGGGPSGTLVTTLAADTGLGVGNWSSHFNMDPTYFHDNLVSNSVIGYYDGRMVAQRGTPLAADDDPSSTMYNASFASTIVSYLNNDLNYTNPSTYTISSNAINVWDFSHAGQQLPDTVPDLAAAMTHNTKLKVLSVNGYHDIVTPFYNTELDLARLGGNPNIAIHFYQGGHMTYLDDVARVQEKADLAAFYASTKSKMSEIVPAVPMAVASETPRSTATMPAAVFETRLRDPVLPDALRNAVPVPPTKDDALKAEVEQRLRVLFDGAHAKRTGTLTRDEAAAAGLGYIVKNFDAIDSRGTGAVTFEDVKRYMREQGATMLPQ
jgi:carboxypeptidase C (cathepsin A)